MRTCASRPRRTTAPFQYSSSLGLPSAMSRCRDVVLPGGELQDLWSSSPALRPGDIVIMDNLGSHKAKAVRQLIRAAGAKLLFLPKYSPDLNPIEQVFAKLKHLLRKAAASQSAKSSEHLRPPNAPTISETQAMPNPKSIML